MIEQTIKRNTRDEKECDINFKKSQLDKKDEKKMLTMKKSNDETGSSRGLLINNIFILDKTHISETLKKRHEKCLNSDYNYYDDRFLDIEKELYYNRLNK